MGDEVDACMLAALARMGLLQQQVSPEPKERPAPLLPSFDLAGVADLIKSGKAKSIICMCGAGISVSAGIPDFRTPGSGLYSQLEKYELSRPEDIFSLGYFVRKPEPFFTLAKELFPGNYQPTTAHYFMRLLHDKGLLLRCFTQNIDSLEHLAGLPKDAVIAAHGNFDSAHCIHCNKKHSTDYVRQAVMKGEICYCDEPCCLPGLVKPDIVFFGEDLPIRFFQLRQQDMPKCDLLIVMGTSLVVHPFAGLLHAVSEETPRLLINREVVGEQHGPHYARVGMPSPGFQFDEKVNYRDAKFLGDCDAGVMELAKLLGWEEELIQLVQSCQSASSMDEGGQKSPAKDEGSKAPSEGREKDTRIEPQEGKGRDETKPQEHQVEGEAQAQEDQVNDEAEAKEASNKEGLTTERQDEQQGGGGATSTKEGQAAAANAPADSVQSATPETEKEGMCPTTAK